MNSNHDGTVSRTTPNSGAHRAALAETTPRRSNCAPASAAGTCVLPAAAANGTVVHAAAANAAASPVDEAAVQQQFLRVFIGNSTSVVARKPGTLRDAIANKMRSSNLTFDKCVAFLKDSHAEVDWNTSITNVSENSIVVKEIKADFYHSFVRKACFKERLLSSNACCNWCKRVFTYGLFTVCCKRCDFTLCSNAECKQKSEKLLCSFRKTADLKKIGATNASGGLTRSYTGKRPSFSSKITKKPRFSNEMYSPSEQILPIGKIFISPTIEHRWFSEPEINLLTSDRISERAKEKFYGQQQKKVSAATGGTANNTNHNHSSSSSKSRRRKDSDSLSYWEIPARQIQVDKDHKIGAGSFGVVHQGHDFYHGIVAVKFLNVQNPSASQIKAFRNEVIILKSTRHDNILSFIGCILTPYLAIVTEWCPGSSLYRHIHVEEEHWEMHQLVDIAKQTATGMEYLHACDILHRDLKSNNIFLIPKIRNCAHGGSGSGRMSAAATAAAATAAANAKAAAAAAAAVSPSTTAAKLQQSPLYKYGNLVNNCDVDEWTVKIGDFGLATVKSTSSGEKRQPTGSLLWMAPEVIVQRIEDPYTIKSDVYSYAVVLFELVTGLLPYSKREQSMILFLVGSGRLKLNAEEARPDTPVQIRELITSCSQFDRDLRLDFVSINKILDTIKYERARKVSLKRSRSAPSRLKRQAVRIGILGGYHDYGDDLNEYDLADDDYETNFVDYFDDERPLD